MNANYDSKKELFLQSEVRDEYLVDEKQKKIWSVELGLISELLRVCEKYDIKVAAYAGTLLGAVRHKGFIPWDDDMDVCMDRKNFEKLLHVPKEEFKSPYFLQTALSDRRYFFGYARLRNSNTTGLISYNKSKNYNNGIYIDIFVLDGYIEDEKKLQKQLKKRDLYSSIIAQYYRDLNELRGIKKIAVLLFKKIFCNCVSYEKMIERYNKTLSMYTSETERLSILTHGEFFIKRYWCFKSDLLNLKDADFEFITVPVSENYDRILNSMYGDYMKFPPVEKRGIWHEGVLTLDPDIPYKEYIESLENE